jgi:hypothetical protein
MLKEAKKATADVALWPKWKRNREPSNVPPIDILGACQRRVAELISNMQERYAAFPFPELALLIEDLHAVQFKIEEEYLFTCGKSPLERLAEAADDDE